MMYKNEQNIKIMKSDYQVYNDDFYGKTDNTNKEGVLYEVVIR